MVSLKEGSWSNQPAYIIGGGPSLRGFDWSLLRDRPNLIALNKAFSYVPWASVCFIEDARFIRRFGEELRSFPGRKIWHVALGTRKAEVQEALDLDPGLELLYETKEGKYWSTSFSDGLSTSTNAAVGAINVADILGADPLYLLGIDCRAEGATLGNFHVHYPPEWQVGAMHALNFKSDMEYWVHTHTRHRKIVNLVNPAFESTVECWPKETLQAHFERVTRGT